MAELVLISKESAAQYKAIRLAALKDSPTAFGSTFAKEVELTNADWLRRAGEWSGEQSVGFLATQDEMFCGLAASFLDVHEPRQAHLVSMWIAPGQRRKKVGFALLEAIQDWAANRDAQILRLMVTNNNEPAIAFYRSSGFFMTGRTEPYPNDPSLFEYEMERSLVVK